MIKKILAILVCAAFSTCAWATYPTKTVCHTVKDAKTGKLVKKCTVVKVHKKFHGTKVPANKKK